MLCWVEWLCFGVHLRHSPVVCVDGALVRGQIIALAVELASRFHGQPDESGLVTRLWEEDRAANQRARLLSKVGEGLA